MLPIFPPAALPAADHDLGADADVDARIGELEAAAGEPPQRDRLTADERIIDRPGVATVLADPRRREAGNLADPTDW